MGEKLLVNPVSSCYGITLNLITYGAPDFLWFFTAYILNLGFFFGGGGGGFNLKLFYIKEFKLLKELM